MVVVNCLLLFTGQQGSFISGVPWYKNCEYLLLMDVLLCLMDVMWCNLAMAHSHLEKQLNNSLKLKPFSNCHWLQPDYTCAQDYSGIKNGWTANFWGFFSSQKMQQKWMFFLKLISKLVSHDIASNWHRKKKSGMDSENLQLA